LKIRIIISIFLVVISFTGSVTAQSEDETELKKVIGTFFKGLQNGDTLTLKKTITDATILQTTYINKEGVSILKTEDIHKFLKAISSKKVADVWEEKLLSYKIQVDGNMANVWTPYKFYLNYKFSHCGVNSFQLFHDGENWKIIYLIDTRRQLGCIE
jgi:hypothetical protein